MGIQEKEAGDGRPACRLPACTMPGSAPQRPKPVIWILLIGLGAAVCAAVVLGWLSEEVLEGDTLYFDEHARCAVHGISNPSLTAAMWFFSALGSVVPTLLLLAGALAASLLLHMRRAMIILPTAMAGAFILELALKLGFHRPRPVPFFGITPPSSFSYPSGHALFAFTFYAMVAFLVTSRIRRRWVRRLIWGLAAAVIMCIGFSRVYLGVHYPTDVIAGYLTGFIWVYSISLLARLRPGAAW